MCSNEIKIEKAGEEMAHKLKTIRADMLMLQYQLERELIRYVKRYLAQPRTTLITEDEALKVILPKRYEIFDEPPKKGKDYNDYLCIQLGIYQSKERSYER